MSLQVGNPYSGLNPYGISSDGVSFIAEYQVAYDAMTTKPSEAIALAQNTMVETIVNGGVWADLDIFVLLASEVNTALEALINWVTPGVFDATLVDTPTFTAFEGITGNGSSSYINTNYSPLFDGINFVQNSGSFGLYMRTLAAGISGCDMGTSFISLTMNSGNSKFNDATWNDPVTGSPDVGMHVYSRSEAAAREIFINKTKYTAATNSTAKNTQRDAYILAYDVSGAASNFMAAQCAAYFFGSSLTQIKVNIITDAIEVYMDSNSKGVIA